MSKVKLSSIIDIISGGTPSTTISEYWENGTIGWLSVTDFNNDLRFVYDSDKKITVAGLKNSNTKMLEVGDIIISARGTVGALAQIGKPLSFNQSCFGLRGKKGLADNNYLYYCLKNYVHNIKKRSQGSVFDTINLNSFDLMEIDIHDLVSQQKIASVLASLDSKIELNNRINSELEQMAKTIYDYWFVQFDFPISAEYAASVGQPQLEGKPYKSSGRKMVWSEELKREVPEGWEVKKLENVINKIIDNRGKTPLKLGGDWSQDGQGVIALSAKHVKDGRLIKLEDANVVTFEMFEKWMPNKLEEGDILMTSEAPCGEFYMILNDTDYCLSQRLFAMRAEKTKVYPSYLYYELAKGNGYSQIIGKQSGSTVFGIRQDELRTVNILVPKLSLQRLFDEKVKPMLLQIRTNEAQCRNLTELRDWLLPMLMNGQVKVGEDVEEEMMGMAAEPLGEYIVRGE